MRQQIMGWMARWWPIVGMVCMVGAFTSDVVEAALAGIALVAFVVGALLTVPGDATPGGGLHPQSARGTRKVAWTSSKG